MSYFQDDGGVYLLSYSLWANFEPFEIQVGAARTAVLSLTADGMTVNGDLTVTGTINGGLEDGVFEDSIEIRANDNNKVFISINTNGDVTFNKDATIALTGYNFRQAVNAGFDINLTGAANVFAESEDGLRAANRIKSVRMGGAPAYIVGVSGRGTFTAPTQTLANDVVAIFQGRGIAATPFETSVVELICRTGSNQTTTNWEGQFEVWLGQAGSGTVARKALLTNAIAEFYTNLRVQQDSAEVDIFMSRTGTNPLSTYFYNTGLNSGFFDQTNNRTIWAYDPVTNEIIFPTNTRIESLLAADITFDIRAVNASYTGSNIRSRVDRAASAAYKHFQALANNVDIYSIFGDGSVLQKGKLTVDLITGPQATIQYDGSNRLDIITASDGQVTIAAFGSGGNGIVKSNGTFRALQGAYGFGDNVGFSFDSAPTTGMTYDGTNLGFWVGADRKLFINSTGVFIGLTGTNPESPEVSQNLTVQGSFNLGLGGIPQNVSFGAADSGGVGFRVLRVPN